MQGVFLACAVRNLAPYVANYVFKRLEGYKVEPPIEIFTPPLTVYTFIAVTGKIISKQLSASALDDEVKGPPKQRVNTKSSQKEQQEENAEFGEVVVESLDEGQEEEDEAVDGDGEEAGGNPLEDMDAEMAELGRLAAEGKPKAKGKGKGKPKATGKPKPKPKGKA